MARVQQHSTDLKELIPEPKRAPYIPTECLQKIFTYLYDDTSSLYASSLVSRDWCFSAINLLWRQTFHLEESKKNAKLLPAYFPFFSDDVREIIGIELPRSERTPLFDYPSFLRQLNYTNMFESISAWWDAQIKIQVQDGQTTMGDDQESIEHLGSGSEQENENQSERRKFCLSLDPEEATMKDDQENIVNLGSGSEQENENQNERPRFCLPLDPEEATMKKVLIAQELARLFMAKCRSFDCLHLETSLLRDKISFKWNQMPYEYLNFPQFPGANNCLANLAAFECGGDYAKGEVFKSLAAICHDLRLMTADGIDYGSDAATNLAHLIEKQKRLQIFIISRCSRSTNEIVSALGTQTETIKHLQFSNCIFSDGDDLENVARCSQLDTLRFNHCGSLSNCLFAPMKTAKFPLLTNLDFTYTFAPTRSLVEMLSSATPNLREVCLGGHAEHSSEIIDGITKYCTQITLFEVTIKRDGIYKLKSLFEKCKKLEVVKFYGDLSNWEGFRDASEVIEPLGSFVPEGLRELVIVTNWAISAEALTNFLKDCQASLTCMAMHCQDYSETQMYRTAVYDYTDRMCLIRDQVQYRVVDRLLEYNYGNY